MLLIGTQSAIINLMILNIKVQFCKKKFNQKPSKNGLEGLKTRKPLNFSGFPIQKDLKYYLRRSNSLMMFVAPPNLSTTHNM
jgi:hypothetical protein